MAYESRILLISNDEGIVRYLRNELTAKGGFLVFSESNTNSGLDAFSRQSFDVVIIKFNMPDSRGLDTIQNLRAIDPDSIIIVFMEEVNQRMLAQMYNLGIYDYISLPINLEKLFFLIKKGIDLRNLLSGHRKFIGSIQEQNVALQKQNSVLARRIEESTRNLKRLYEDLRSTYMHTIKVLAQALEAKDAYTRSHSENVAKYAVIIAEELKLSANEIQLIREACELHDLGKIGIHDYVLGKSSGLTPQEWQEVKQHPMTAAQILEPLAFLNEIIELVKQHHENYDGSGYPKGLKGEEITLGARIIRVADAYEAMRSSRSYRKIPLFKQEAVEEIKKNSGTQFDPLVAEVFLRVVDKL